MNAYNKTQFTYVRITCVLKDLGCDRPLPKILMLAILATCASSSSTKSLPLFSNPLSTRLTQDQKGLSKACNGHECKGKILGLFMQVSKQANHSSHRHLSQTRLHTFASMQQSLQENQFDKWLITTRCKEFTYCLCNFIWPHHSRTFMFIQLRALFKSLVLIKTETQIFAKEQPHSVHEGLQKMCEKFKIF
ncbi:hypothetical protein H5410_005003 [Solanum commersonii]|uniref:Uncharacterized protein n=1 Tax=Solanum commersonii TaxID=4109 RepID=A0A9J6A5G5_SOLCO|nr:hypothetical protein H5410_005003 [Solanum commersonii]